MFIRLGGSIWNKGELVINSGIWACQAQNQSSDSQSLRNTVFIFISGLNHLFSGLLQELLAALSIQVTSFIVLFFIIKVICKYIIQIKFYNSMN